MSNQEERQSARNQMSVQEHLHMLAMVSDLYYNLELTQQEIADRLYTSRSRISRMLKEARTLGVVEITIRMPWSRKLEYEKLLEEQFPGRQIRVVAADANSPEDQIEKLASAAAYYVDAKIKPGMILGISWGNTLFHIVKDISLKERRNIPITVVPIMGGAAGLKGVERDAANLARDLASTYGGEYKYIYAPLFVKDRKVKEILIQDDNIKTVLNLLNKADIILTSVGSISSKSWKNFLSEEMLELLEQHGAVGHLGGHFFDSQGKELPTSLADSMIGIRMEAIRNCKEVICVAAGEEKAEAALGVMNGNLIDTLIIDEQCAEKMLILAGKSSSV